MILELLKLNDSYGSNPGSEVNLGYCQVCILAVMIESIDSKRNPPKTCP